MSIAAYEAAEGKTDFSKPGKLIEELSSLEETPKEKFTFVTTDIATLLNETTLKPGLQWRLEFLRKSLGSLRDGDFGYIFARPETGKTTFIASEISYMLQQAAAIKKSILIIGNEEAGNKYMLRIMQAYFGVTLEQLISSLQEYQRAFNEQAGVFLNLYESASCDRDTVEAIVKQTHPALVVIDQLDKLQGFDGERDDLRMGKIYQFGRELAKQGRAVIGVTQADGSGEGVRWLHAGNTANAKTAKQAEADFIIGIGKIHEPGYESVRFLSLIKNKLVGDRGITDPALRHGRKEVLIEETIARYRDL